MIEITKEYFKVKEPLWYNKLVWKSKEGIKTPITKLKDSHLSHILRCFLGHSPNYKFQGIVYGTHSKLWIKAITEELERRKSS